MRSRVLGNYLLKTLGPVEREEVHWRWIVGVRAWDLLMAGWAWKAVKGEARRDGGELRRGSSGVRARLGVLEGR